MFQLRFYDRLGSPAAVASLARAIARVRLTFGAGLLPLPGTVLQVDVWPQARCWARKLVMRSANTSGRSNAGRCATPVISYQDPPGTVSAMWRERA